MTTTNTLTSTELVTLDVACHATIGAARRNPDVARLTDLGLVELRWYELSNGKKVQRVFATQAGRLLLDARTTDR